MTLNLIGAGTSQLTIAQNTEGIKTAITTFIDSYNAYAEVLESYTTYNTADEDNPVAGLLQNDSMAREMASTLRAKATQMSSSLTSDNASYTYGDQTGVMNTLSSVGIWTTGTENRLALTDEDRFDTLLQQDPDKVEQLFRGVQTTSGSRAGGIALSLYTTSKNYSSDLDGWIDVRIENINDEIDDYTERIDKMIAAMETKEAMLWEQFNAMDEAIAEMNSNLDYLKQNLGLDSDS